MCSCDFDDPSVYREEVRLSRKERRCDECPRTIPRGDFYTNIFGVWDGYAKTFALCDTCTTVRNLADGLHREEGEGRFCWALGDMADAIRECWPHLFWSDEDDEEEAA